MLIFPTKGVVVVLPSIRPGKKKEEKKVAMDPNYFSQWISPQQQSQILTEASQQTRHESRPTSSLEDWSKERTASTGASTTAPTAATTTAPTTATLDFADIMGDLAGASNVFKLFRLIVTLFFTQPQPHLQLFHRSPPHFTSPFRITSRRPSIRFLTALPGMLSRRSLCPIIPVSMAQRAQAPRLHLPPSQQPNPSPNPSRHRNIHLHCKLSHRLSP